MFPGINNFDFKIHREGKMYVALFVVISFLCFAISFSLGVVSLVLAGFCASFFRNPERVTANISNGVFSPADGVVTEISSNVLAPEELEVGTEKMQKISIFLSVFNVHVNRVPVAGEIERVEYHAGKFFNATLDKSSSDNERNSVLMRAANGQKVVFVQIAGLIARRIVCNIKEGQKVEAGERFGIIKFGSRMDVYLPQSAKVSILKGQTCVGGETLIAVL